MTSFVTADALTALLQVVFIDLVLAGDKAVVIGLAAAGLPAEQRRRAILIGIVVATALRIAFALDLVSSRPYCRPLRKRQRLATS
jgi:predicted tellurium resistance membrane protein TerC